VETELAAKTPQPPTEKDQPFKHLSWWFYQGRQALYQDQHYDPWSGKHLKQCQRIVRDKARGDIEVVRERAANLYRYAQKEPGFWNFLPGDLESKWERLVLSPDAKPGKLKDSTDEYLDKLAREAGAS